MLEQEIKLHIPSVSVPAVRRQLMALPGSGAERLHAMYFDTPDRQLARQKMALRLRREGGHWVQTLKASAGDAFSRHEFNHARPEAALDLSVYEQTPMAAHLQALQGRLVVRYETEVARLSREFRESEGRVEAVLDHGEIRAGELVLPVAEMEFEHLDGSVASMFGLAERWCGEHHLILDLRSKAEQGDGLAQAWHSAQGCKTSAERQAAAWQRYWQPQRVQAEATPAGAADESLRAVTARYLEQIVGNASLLADAHQQGLSLAVREEAQQLWRSGVKNLLAAWEQFEGVTPLPPANLRELARDFLRRTEGMKKGEPAASSELASPEWQIWQLRMLAWSTLPDSH